MKGWQKVTLEDITTRIGDGLHGTPKYDDSGEYYFVNGNNLSNGRVIIKEDTRKISEKEYLKIKKELTDRTILVAINGTLGNLGIYRGEKIALGKSACYLNIKEDVNKDFIRYILENEPFQKYAELYASGATIKNLGLKAIRDFSFQLPSLHIQNQIASILSAYDDLIENNLQRIKLLEETAQITFNEWFGKEKDLPKGWEVKKLKDVADITMGQSPESEFYNNERIGLPFHQGVTGYGYRFPENKTWSSEGTRFAEKGDILFSVRAPVGRLNIAIEKIILGRGLGAFRHKKGWNSFLYYQLRKIFFKEDLMGGGSIFNSVTKTDVEKIEIIEADEKLMTKFNDFANPIDVLIENLTKENRLLKEARDILLPRLLNGTISVEKAEAKVISIAQPKQKEATWEFKEAVLISLLTEKFGSEKFPLGRKRYTKLSYLFHRHADNQMQNYLRKAAGPYNPKTKYAGPEKIAHQNGYVADHKNGNLTGFIAGKNISAAKTYFENYWSIDYLNWLESNFKFKSNDQLELYATVDNALLELHKKNKTVNVEAVKQIIKTEREWKAKLEREIFNDTNIQKAITYLPTLFQYS